MKIIVAPVPYGGGISKCGEKVYIDPHLPKWLKVDGFKVPVHKITAYHERREWEHMQKGLHYGPAHHKALKYENSKLAELGLNSKQIAAYQKKVIGYCNQAYEENAGTPKDLFTGPYEDERESMLGHSTHHVAVKKTLKVDA